jgi:hypothetical protein
VSTKPGNGLAATLLLALVLALAGCGGKSDSASQVRGAKPVVKPTPAQGKVGNVVPATPPKGNGRVDPDLLAKSGVDVAWAVMSLGGNRYELTVQNTSRVGYVETFDWRPPDGDTIVTVSDSSAGSCELVDGRVHCSALHLKPPTCLCRPGGTETVVFTMRNADDSLGLEGSGLTILEMTPILENIPSTPHRPGV